MKPRSIGHPGYSVKMDRVPEAAREARVMVRVVLSTWGLDAAADEAALLLSELVTNAVRHAQGPTVRVVVDRPADNRVCLAVIDRAPRRTPEIRTPHPDDASGRGLQLIDEITDRWGWNSMGSSVRPWGKRVWAELKVSP